MQSVGHTTDLVNKEEKEAGRREGGSVSEGGRWVDLNLNTTDRGEERRGELLEDVRSDL